MTKAILPQDDNPRQRLSGRSQRRPQASVPASSARSDGYMEFEQQVGCAPRYERGEERAWTSATARVPGALRHADGHAHRFGGAAPSLATAAISPSFMEPNTRSEARDHRLWFKKPLSAEFPRARSTSSRRVMLGITSISKSVASEYFKELDEEACSVP